MDGVPPAYAPSVRRTNGFDLLSCEPYVGPTQCWHAATEVCLETFDAAELAEESRHIRHAWSTQSLHPSEDRPIISLASCRLEGALACLRAARTYSSRLNR